MKVPQFAHLCIVLLGSFCQKNQVLAVFEPKLGYEEFYVLRIAEALGYRNNAEPLVLELYLENVESEKLYLKMDHYPWG